MATRGRFFGDYFFPGEDENPEPTEKAGGGEIPPGYDDPLGPSPEARDRAIAAPNPYDPNPNPMLRQLGLPPSPFGINAYITGAERSDAREQHHRHAVAHLPQRFGDHDRDRIDAERRGSEEALDRESANRNDDGRRDELDFSLEPPRAIRDLSW